MQDLGIVGLKNGFFFSILLKVLRKNIRSSIRLAISIINIKKIPKKLLSPANLLWTQRFYINKVTKVFIVYKNKNLILLTF